MLTSNSSNFGNKNDDNCRCINHYMDSRPKLQLQTQTTHKTYYKQLPLQKPVQHERPKVEQKHYDAQVLQTSYKSQYTAKQNQRNNNNNNNNYNVSASSLINSYMKNKPQVPFYSDTSYKDQFKAHQVKVQRQPTYQYKPNNNKFQGQSSYKSDFNNKKNTDLANVGQSIINNNSVKDYMNRRPNLPFQGSSSYKDTFKKYEVKVDKQPEYQYKPNTNKFEGASSYKDTFKAPGKQAYNKGLEYCPIHPDKIAMK